VNPDNTVSAAGQITDPGCTPPVTVYGFVYAKHSAPYTGSEMYKTGDKALAIFDQTPLYQGIIPILCCNNTINMLQNSVCDNSVGKE
jgi:hypothetical protein